MASPDPLTYRAALQRLSDAAGRFLDDASEASPEVRADLRRRLGEAQTDAADTLHTSNGIPDGYTRYDLDPDALAWAREKIQWEIDRMRMFEQQATENGSDPTLWRQHTSLLEGRFIGGTGCVIASFDARMPALARSMLTAEPYRRAWVKP